jgi:uncharacterized protein YndB with AHSA1/START domain
MITTKKELTLKKTISMKAPAAKVWETLTKPEFIKQWLYGTNTISDWKVGSPIIFTGNWQGVEYKDKGTILDLEADKILRYDYWSAFSGLPDSPENYSIITFDLTPKDHDTMLTLTQTNFANETMYSHSEQNWDATLDTMKKFIENS